VDYLPLFAELKERPVLVIGGGEIAERKIKFLLRAGAGAGGRRNAVTGAGRSGCAPGTQLAGDEFSDSLVDDVFLVIAATEDEALNQRVFAPLTRATGWSTWWITSRCARLFSRRSSTVRRCWWRSPPAVKRRCCRAFCVKNRSAAADEPRAAGGISQLLAQPSENPPDDHRSASSLLGARLSGRFASLMVAGKAEAEKALQDELDKPERETGEIILVGAGPGDAGLLTLRGLQVLQQADVVFYDHLVTGGARAGAPRCRADLRRQTRRRALGAAA
jgi:uroporphyrin-III C-methyltransferase/precorrin-2 dehydrogenase/sirohydrochlorin ferrochelatase